MFVNLDLVVLERSFREDKMKFIFLIFKVMNVIIKVLYIEIDRIRKVIMKNIIK